MYKCLFCSYNFIPLCHQASVRMETLG